MPPGSQKFDGYATVQVVRTLDTGRFDDPKDGEKGILEAYLRAIANAKSEAQALATAAGVTLGPLVTVSNAANSPFYGPFYAFGSFGPNKFCGKARVFHFQKGKDGKRHRTFETKFVCRYPHQIQRQVQLTYALG